MANSLTLPEGVTLYVIRHGETDWNAERRYQGQVDVPLNDKGRAQARRNGEALATCGLAPQAVDFVASPLGRARETMEIVRTRLGLEATGYRLDPALKELSYGHWQGVLQSELPARDPKGVAARAKDPFTWRPDDGESYADLLGRTETWLKGVRRDSVIAAHGGTLRCLHALLLGLPDKDVPTLAVPQDRVLIVKNGKGTWL